MGESIATLGTILLPSSAIVEATLASHTRAVPNATITGAGQINITCEDMDSNSRVDATVNITVKW